MKRACPVDALGLDVSPDMVAQARRSPSRPGGGRTARVVGLAEHLPFTTSVCSAITCFNAIHHIDLASFMDEAARVLAPQGLLVLYTRTPEQNRQTIWGRHFPDFAARETRLHSVDDLRTAVRATGAFATVNAQIVPWRVTTARARLLEQVTRYHYSTFRLYSPDALRTAIDTFHSRLARLGTDGSDITWDNDHVLVVAERRASTGMILPMRRMALAFHPLQTVEDLPSAG